MTTIADLQALPNWVCFSIEPQPAGKPKKIPYIPGTTQRASVNDPSTWRTYTEACADGRHPGVAITPALGLTLIDIDGQSEHPLIAALDSYTERSINGGLHILVRGRPPEGFTTPPGIEVYPRTGNRFVLVTGDVVDGRSAIEDRTGALAALFPPRPMRIVRSNGQSLDTDDQTIIEERILRMPKGRQLHGAGDTTGYPSGSEADLALLNVYVAAGVTCPNRLDALYRQGALYPERQKRWDDSRYRERTITKALDGTVVPFEGWERATSIPRSHSVPPVESPPLRADESDSTHDLLTDNPRLQTENAGLRSALDACCADRAELRRQNADLRASEAQVKRDLAAVIKTIDNPNLGGDAAGKALVLAAVEVQHRSHTVPPGDGYVQINASRIADNREWVAQRDAHGAPIRDEDGAPVRVPVPIPARISPRTVTKYIGLAAGAGLIDAKKDEIPAPVGKPGITNEGWYWKAAPTLADQLAPLASGSVYSDDNPRPLRGGNPDKRRRLKSLPGCPECGGHHVACATCGTIYDTPIAVDLDSGQTLGAAEMPTKDDPVSLAVVDVRMSTSLSPGVRAHSVPPEKRARLDRAAADLASREPSWLRDVPDPWDTPPQPERLPTLFPLDDPTPPGQSSHFSAD